VSFGIARLLRVEELTVASGMLRRYAGKFVPALARR
jgi:hypothetical protein